MDKRLKQYCSIKLHYRHGRATVALQMNGIFEVIHSHGKAVSDLHEVFILYKAYERFIAERGWHLVAYHLAKENGIRTQDKSINQVIKEIHATQQKRLKEMDLYV